MGWWEGLYWVEELLYFCDGCKETFSKAYSLKVHKGVRTGEHPYCCDVLIKHSVKHTV